MLLMARAMTKYGGKDPCEQPSCRAEEGAEGAREVLQLTPCDLWPYLRGRTLWLVGDSMMQACTLVPCLSQATVTRRAALPCLAAVSSSYLVFTACLLPAVGPTEGL